MSAQSYLFRLLRAVFDDLFPPTCAGCDRREHSGTLCPGCAATLPEALVRNDVRQLDACYSGTSYEGFVLERIRRFKYPRSRLGLEPGPERLALWLICRAAESIRDRPDAVVPVPQHPRRIRQRGFVPALVLARRLGRAYDLPCRPGMLRRVLDTSKQTDLRRAERRRNVRDAFRPVGVVPQVLWLVDDVMTTGATLEAAARALRSGGARCVLGITAASTPLR